MDDENERIRIAILTASTLQDRKRSSWGGTVDQIARTLQLHCGTVDHIGSIYPKRRVLGKIIHKTSRLLLKKNYLYNHTFSLARKYAKVAERRLAVQSYDVIIAPSGGTEIAFLETEIPIILVEDANFALLQDYYTEYSNLLKRSAFETNTLEELAIKRASLVIHPSEWAVRSTIEHYHTDHKKVHAVPFGANLESPPSREVVNAKRRTDHCRLLFLGVNWQRKGGEIAFEALLKLEELGVQAELIVVGCTPPKEFTHERLTVIPYLNKQDEKQRQQLGDLFKTSDFLFLPTRSECYGMVFCEASAYGLPVISTNTGGVSGAVQEGENGFLLPPLAGGSEYAELIARVYKDEEGYAELVKTSRGAFEARLNWDSWGLAVKKLMYEMLGCAPFTTGNTVSKSVQ
jgi:glycosyltransferase involved in cell wall biosynthesis